MVKEVTLTIDGQQVSVPEGTLVVDAAKKIGIDIPVFCYHPKMEPVGMCRMCLVDIGRPVRDRDTGELVLEEDGSPKIQFGWKLDTACTVPVSEGMVVQGMTEKVQEARNDILEFLLTSHPLDCPICDKGGECPLQNLTMAFGPAESRFLYDDKIHLDKHVPLGELIYLDRERCIQCARCTRFQSDIADDPVIGFYQRGRSLEIVTYSEPGFDSYWSGNTTDICPVGALTTADFRFGARPWELNTAASICTHCPVGCNLSFNTRREAKSGGEIVIKRAMPRQNEWVNELWICDKGRFAYHFTESEDRLTQPLIRVDGELAPATWDEALELVATKFKQSGKETLTLVSGRLSNEDLFSLKRLADGVG
ncbi:MAG: (2Fe-2S)-binding protein, partial [Anaerolineales bacterium]|nr:(2Fe-2S)-binding protein [Anaerolineales bacterium]